MRTWRAWFRQRIIPFLAVGMLVGCGMVTEAEMRCHAREFITGLDVEVLEEDHGTHTTGPYFGPGTPTSYIYSTYKLSNSPAEVKRKLRALYPVGEIWMEYLDGNWQGEAPLDLGLLTPDEARERVLYMLGLIQSDPILKEGGDDLPKVVILLMCPYSSDPGDPSIYDADLIALTEDGHLLAQFHASAISRCHAGGEEER